MDRVQRRTRTTMFNSKPAVARALPAPSRRNGPSVMHRKLSIELMERRLMLSTTSAELPPIEFRSVPATSEAYEVYQQVGESAPVATADDDDGGYIGLSNNSSWDAHTDQTVPVVGSTLGNYYHDPVTSPYYGNSGGSNSGSPFVPTVDSDGLQPVVIVGS